jgi:hypothetical protein
VKVCKEQKLSDEIIKIVEKETEHYRAAEGVPLHKRSHLYEQESLFSVHCVSHLLVSGFPNRLLPN